MFVFISDFAQMYRLNLTRTSRSQDEHRTSNIECWMGKGGQPWTLTKFFCRSTERSTELTPKSHAEVNFARTLQL